MPAPSLPRQIHRYEILAELGRGSTGRVYLARDPRIDRRIALKVLRPERLRGDADETRQRFLREARAAGRLSHRGIVTIYDADTDPESGCPYLAMEWIQGGSLKSLLRRDGRLDIARAVDLAVQVARALDYAHRRDVVHRDVKPANLLVAGDGSARSPQASRVKIVDFGIARLLSHSITLPGRVLGSPYYMSPEQVGGRGVDGRADLFALGAVLYEALGGQVPFPGDSVAAVTHEILTAEPRPIEGLRPGVPPSLRAVVGRALAKLPDDRFQTGAELAAALETVGAELVLGTGPGTPPASLLGRRRNGSETRPLSASTEVLERPGASTATLAPAASRALRPVILAALVLVGILIGHWPARLATPEAELLVMDSRTLDHAPPRPPPSFESPATPTPEVPFDGGAGPEPGTAGGEHGDALVGAGGPRQGDRGSTFWPGPAFLQQEPPSVPATPLSGGPAGAPEFRAHRSAFWPSPALLEIVHENRFRHAVLSVRVDGEKALSVELRTKNPLSRVSGRQHRWTIPIAAGERVLEIRLAGVSKPFAARREVAAVFAAAEARRLRIEVDPGSRELTLAWLE